MIEPKFAPREISLGFDGIIHSHCKKPETMTHIPFPITLIILYQYQLILYARLETYPLPEHIPQNCLQNGWAIVEVSELLFRVFCCMLTIFSVT